jgi:glycerol uptake facilitator-like aquaporin
MCLTIRCSGIFVLVYTIFNTSGGNINPAITLTLVLGKRMSLFRGVLYVIAQVRM